MARFTRLRERLTWSMAHGEATSLSKRLRRQLRSEALSWVADPSYAREWPAVQNLLARRTHPHGQFLVDIGASDGLTGSVTLPLLRQGWEGLLLEPSPAQFGTLAMHHQRFEGVALAQVSVTERNVGELLSLFDVPSEFGFLNVDIDSLDAHVVRSLLQCGFRPDVISIEINEKVPPPIYFSIRSGTHASFPIDHIYGCSLTAATSVMRPFGYALAEVRYNNALFAHTPAFRSDIKDLPDQTAYLAGYSGAPDRQRLFPWNQDVDHWRTLAPQDALAAIREYVADRGLSNEVDLWIS